MNRYEALLVMLAVAGLVLIAMAWAWRRRARRDQHLNAPVGSAPTQSAPLERFSVWYVATTAPDNPLERLAIRGLTYRAAGDLATHPEGLSLVLDGSPAMFVPAQRLIGADQSTVAIDRVVEPGGLVRLTWLVDTEHPVDTYLRPRDTSAPTLTAALRRMIRPHTTMDTPA